MRIGVINFSGNVGKSTVAKHLLHPRVGGQLIEVETFNQSEGGDMSIRGKSFGQLQEYLQEVDEAIVDVGASNVDDFVKLMKQYHGSHEDFDYFVIPVVKEEKQQKDTVATIEALSSLGVPAKKMRVVFNKIDTDDSVEDSFPAILNYVLSEKKCVARPECAIVSSEVFEKLKPLGKTIGEVLEDDTDYRAKMRSAQSDDEKAQCRAMISAQRLAFSANQNLDSVFKFLFK